MMLDKIIFKGFGVHRDRVFTFKRGINIITGKNRTGKCIVGNSLLTLKNTCIKISDLFTPYSCLIKQKNRETIFKNPFNIAVQTKSLKYKIPSHLFFGGKKNTIQIECFGGFSIEGTFNHPILVSDGERVVFKTLKEIYKKPKAYELVIPHTYWNNKSVKTKLKKPVCNEHFRKLKVNYPLHFDKDLAYFLGLYSGDGNISMNSISFFIDNQNNELVWWLQKYAKKLGLKSAVKKYTNYKTVRINSSSLIQFLYQNKLTLPYVYSKTKIMPQVFWTAETIKAFIAGLFATDGSFYKQLELSLYSEEIITFLHNVLTQFGIFSIKAPKKVFWKDGVHIHHRLTISGTDALKMVHLGFITNKKLLNKISKDKISNTKISYFRKHNNEVYLTYKKKKEIIKNLPKGQKAQIYKNSSHYTPFLYKFNKSYNRRFSKLSLQQAYKIAKQNSSSYRDAYLDFICGNYWLLPIRKIQKSKNYVYDLTIPQEHTFIANNIVNHNTLIMEGASYAFFGKTKNSKIEKIINYDATQAEVELFITPSKTGEVKNIDKKASPAIPKKKRGRPKK